MGCALDIKKGKFQNKKWILRTTIFYGSSILFLHEKCMIMKSAFQENKIKTLNYLFLKCFNNKCKMIFLKVSFYKNMITVLQTAIVGVYISITCPTCISYIGEISF